MSRPEYPGKPPRIGELTRPEFSTTIGIGGYETDPPPERNEP
jgi:hypothetical protein